MKNLICSFLILFFSFISNAQFSVNGQVVSNIDVIPFNSFFLLHKEDSSMVKGTISSEYGTYLFENVVYRNYFL